jgi:iron complex transport system substrate-binding protein
MKNRLLVALLAFTVLLSGCGRTAKIDAPGATSETPVADNTTSAESTGVPENGEPVISVSGNSYPLTVKDYLDYNTTLETKPQRVAVLSGTPMNIWYDLEGKSICTSDVSKNLRITEGYEDEIRALPTVGQVYAINVEAVVEQQPDLIIAQVGTQSTAAKALREMGFNVIQTHIRGFSDVIDTYRAFGIILGKSELAEQRISGLTAGKNTIVEKLPNKQVSVVILYVTSRSLAVKLDNSIAGDIASILKLHNIASDLPPDTIGSETTPLDIEYIVEQNPDYVLVTTMISSNEEARNTVEKQFSSNPAWSSVSAIAESRVLWFLLQRRGRCCDPNQRR